MLLCPTKVAVSIRHAEKVRAIWGGVRGLEYTQLSRPVVTQKLDPKMDSYECKNI